MTTADPFEVLRREAPRQEAEEQAARRVSAGRARLVLGKGGARCFFATLALGLRPVPDWDQETMATDGHSLFYNPDFTRGLSPPELEGVLAHEVLHKALAHHARRGSRCPRRWNAAADLAENQVLRDAGFTLPQGALFPGEGAFAGLPPGLSAEEYYARLPSGGGAGEGADPGGCGAVVDPGDGSEAACRQAESEAKVAASQARQAAKGRGTLPGGLDRLVDELLAPKVDWREVLRVFVSRSARSEYSWARPNRRFAWQGLYLPSLYSEELGDVVVAVDTSGSISPELLGRFAAEAQGILDGFACTLSVVYHDSRVQHVQTWRSSDGPLVLEARGGGGTSHVPVFDWVQGEGLQPACLVALTDCFTRYPDRPPDYPVLWAVAGNEDPDPPFGQVVQVGE